MAKRRLLLFVMILTLVLSLVALAACTKLVYTVSFDSNGAGEVASQQIKEGEKATAPTAPSKTGYVFEGWYLSGSETAYSFDAPVTGDISLVAKWSASNATAYTVKHLQQKLDGSGYTEVEADRQSLTGTTGEQTSARAKSYKGFNAQAVTQAEIKADGSTVIEIKYDRKIYTVTFDSNGGSAVASQQIKYEGKVDASAVSTTRQDYSFINWLDEDGEVFDLATETIKEDVVLKASWHKANESYTVKHMQQKVDGSGYEEVVADRQALTGAVGGQTQAQAKSYTGFTAQAITQQTIAEDGSTVIEVKYDRNQFTVTFVTGEGSAIQAQTVLYGAKINSANAVTTRSGYALMGWVDASEQPFDIANTVITANVTLTAVWQEANTGYVVKHLFQSASDLTKYEENATLQASETKQGATNALTSAQAKEIIGFTAQAFEQATIKADGTTVVEIKYDRNTYYITYNPNGIAYADASSSDVQAVKYGVPYELYALEQKTYSTYKWVDQQGKEFAVSGTWELTENIGLTAQRTYAVIGFEDGQNNMFGEWDRNTDGKLGHTYEVVANPTYADEKALKVTTLNHDDGDVGILASYVDEIFADPNVKGFTFSIYAESVSNANDGLDIRFSNSSTHAPTTAGYRFNNYKPAACGSWMSYIYTREMYNIKSPLTTGDFRCFFFNRYEDTFYIDNVTVLYSGFELGLDAEKSIVENDLTTARAFNSSVKSAVTDANGTIIAGIQNGTKVSMDVVNASTQGIPQELVELLGSQSAFKITNESFSTLKFIVSTNFMYAYAQENVIGFAYDIYVVNNKEGNGYKKAENTPENVAKYEEQGLVISDEKDEISSEIDQKEYYFIKDKQGNKVCNFNEAYFGDAGGGNNIKIGYLEDGVHTIVIPRDYFDGNADKTVIKQVQANLNDATFFRMYVGANCGEFYIYNLRPVYAEKYSIAFDVAGGEELEALQSEGVLDIDGIIPEKAGYTFDGWFCGNLEITDEVASHFTVTHNITLVAHWTANEYELAFEGEQADGSAVETDALTIAYDGTVSGIPAIQEKAGYTGKWMVGSFEIKNGDIWKYTEDKTAQLVYTPNEYELTIEYKCGEETIKESATVQVAYGTSYTIVPATISGYTLVDGQTLAITMDSVEGKSATLLYTAKTYTVNFYEQLGSNDPTALTIGEVSSITVTFGKALGELLPAQPDKTDYNKEGWILEISGQDPIAVTSEYVWNIDMDNGMLIAKYKAEGTLTVHYYLADSTTSIKEDFTEDIEVGAFSKEYDVPAITGYTYASVEGGAVAESKVTIEGSMTLENAECILYYTANSYTVTYDANGGSAVQEATAIFGQQFALGTTTRQDYRLIGWFNGDTKVADNSAWNIDDDVTLTARWEETLSNQIVSSSGEVNKQCTEQVSDGEYSVKFVLSGSANIRMPFNTLKAIFDDSSVASIALDVYFTESATDFRLRLPSHSGAKYLPNFNIGVDNKKPENVGTWLTFEFTREWFETYKSQGVEGQDYSMFYVGAATTFYMDNVRVLKAGQTTNFVNAKVCDGAMYTIGDGDLWYFYTTANSKAVASIANDESSDADNYSYKLDVSASAGNVDVNLRRSFISLMFADPSVQYVKLDVKSSVALTGVQYHDGNNDKASWGNIPADEWTTLVITRDMYNATFKPVYDQNGSAAYLAHGSTTYNYIFRCNNDGAYTLYFDNIRAEQGELCTITYVVGENGTMTAQATAQVRFGSDLTLPEVTADASHVFDGWYNGETKVENGKWTGHQDVTLTAKYTAKQQYTIMLNADGGSFDGESTISICNGEAITLPTPTKEGFTFLGWYDGETKIESGATWTKTENTTLVAMWKSPDYVPVKMSFEDSSKTAAYNVTTNDSGTGLKDEFGIYFKSGLGEGGKIYFRYQKDYLNIKPTDGNFHIRFTWASSVGSGIYSKLYITKALADQMFADARTTYMAFDIMVNDEGDKADCTVNTQGGSVTLKVGVWTTIYLSRAQYEAKKESDFYLVTMASAGKDARFSLDNFRSIATAGDFEHGTNELISEYYATNAGHSFEVVADPTNAENHVLKVVTTNHDNGDVAINEDYLNFVFSDSAVTALTFKVYAASVEASGDGLDIRFSDSNGRSSTAAGYRYTNYTGAKVGEWFTVTYTRAMYENKNGSLKDGYRRFFFNRYDDTFYLDDFTIVKG